MEFHPALWSIGSDLRLSGDDYFFGGPYVSPVSDYVAASGDGLGATSPAPTVPNEIPAKAWQRGLAEILQPLMDAGLFLETVREYPFANGCKVLGSLVRGEGRRWHWLEGTARLPLMFGLSARAP